MNQTQSMWLNNSFLEYEYHTEVSIDVKLESWQQQYEIYNNAESIVKRNPNNQDLACAIFQLNRAIDFREDLLNQQYNFKKIPGFHNEKLYESMCELGIIKPMLKTKLDKIRNNVMHSAEYPVPKLSEVEELTEFTWYFLKSTDLIASRNVERIIFNDSPHDDNDEWMEISFNLHNWEITIRGMFLNHNISDKFFEQSVEVFTNKITQKGETTFIDGKLLKPINEIQNIIKIYFAIL